MPKGSYAEVIKGPAHRLEGTKRALKIEEALVDALLADIEEGGAKDALPLLAFTLERLYREAGGDGDLKLSEYEELGRVKGSIEAAVERALKAADNDPKIPRDRAGASCAPAARPHSLACRHRSRHRQLHAAASPAVRRSLKRAPPDRPSRRATPARDRHCQGHRRGDHRAGA